MSGPSRYESLVVPHLNDLRTYCVCLTRSNWDGEDLMQETLLRTYVYFLSHTPADDLRAFLRRVARNVWIDQCRMQRRRRNLAPAAARSWHSDSDYAEVLGLVEWLSERLPSRNVRVWLLAEYFGYAMQEIAEDMGTTVSAVKSLLFRTRDVIRSREDAKTRNVIRLDAERWCRAVLQENPRLIAAER